MPGLSPVGLPVLQQALVEASRRVTLEGAKVRFVGSVLVGWEGRWLGLFHASSADAVRRVSELAQLPGQQVDEAREVWSTCLVQEVAEKS